MLTDKNETSKNKLKESNILNNNTNALYHNYPEGYYVCGYPNQLITDYNFLEKLNCDWLKKLVIFPKLIILSSNKI